MASIAQWLRCWPSDAGGLGFESRTPRVTGKSIPKPWRDKHPAVNPVHRAGAFHPDRKDSLESQRANDKLACNIMHDSMICRAPGGARLPRARGWPVSRDGARVRGPGFAVSRGAQEQADPPIESTLRSWTETPRLFRGLTVPWDCREHSLASSRGGVSGAPRFKTASAEEATPRRPTRRSTP